MARTNRLCLAFPNQLGANEDGQPTSDPWESFLMFLRYCQQGTGYLIDRSAHAATWLSHYDNLMQQLSIVRATLPRVKISAEGQSYESLMEQAQLLVNYLDIFLGELKKLPHQSGN